MTEASMKPTYDALSALWTCLTSCLTILWTTNITRKTNSPKAEWSRGPNGGPLISVMVCYSHGSAGANAFLELPCSMCLYKMIISQLVHGHVGRGRFLWQSHRGIDEASIRCLECLTNGLDILSDNSLHNKHNTENKQPLGRLAMLTVAVFRTI